MPKSNSTVAVYRSHTEAKEAVKVRQREGFDLAKLSITKRDYHTFKHVIGYYHTPKVRICRRSVTGSRIRKNWERLKTRAKKGQKRRF